VLGSAGALIFSRMNRAQKTVATAAAQSTMMAEISLWQDAARTVAAASTETAIPAWTGTAAVRATGTAKYRATRTAVARATLQSIDRFVQAAENSASKVFQKEGGSLSHKNDDLIEIFNPGIQLEDFIAEVKFTNPYETSKGPWDYGFLFRDQGSNDQYRLYVDSNKRWELSNYKTDSTYTMVDEGFISDLRTGAGASNTLWLLCKGERGILFVNGNFVAELDLSARQEAGIVRVGTGFEKGHEVEGYSTMYKGFIIWKIP
jgi:hypothetical protein